MKIKHFAIGSIGLLLLSFSIYQIMTASQGMEISTDYSAIPPTTIITPEETPESRPLVLAGHGFAGSRQNMYAFALTIAHAGYPVVLWDFDGHGFNPNQYPEETARSAFLSNAVAALQSAKNQGLGKSEEITILGHSMGSGVALEFGQEYPSTQSTIAVSPVPRSVTPTLPRNLLLMAGSNEASFVANAETLLTQAGGTGGLHAEGTARESNVIPGVEHISILFAPAAHNAAVSWLNATYGEQAGAKEYTDTRIAWWGVGLLGTLLISYAIAPLTADNPNTQLKARTIWRQILALCGGALGATLSLWLLDLAGIQFRAVLGLLVGGYLLIWFVTAGVISLAILRIKPKIPSSREIMGGLAAFAILWLGVGLLTHSVWMNWILIPKRLLLWPLGALLLFPWFLAVGQIVQGKRLFTRLGWWLLYSLILAIGLFLAITLSSSLGFLLLILSLIPFILGLHAVVAWSQHSAWAFAISGSLWISWAFIAVFPLK